MATMSTLRAHVLVAAAFATTASVGCYAPAFRDCELQCGPGDSCPDGLRCEGRVCRDPSASGTCSVQQQDAPIGDTVLDTPMAKWSSPTEVAGIGVGYQDPTLNGAMTEMYLSRQNQILVSNYNPASMMWTSPQPVPEFTAAGAFTSPMLSFNGAVMHVTSASANADIWRAFRQAGSAFQNLNPVAELNSNAPDSGGAMDDASVTILLSSNRQDPTNVDLFQASWNSATLTWRPPVPLAMLNDPVANDAHAVFDSTGLRVVFSSDRSGNYDLYVSQRASLTSAFDPPQPITDLNTAVIESDPWLSPDGRTLYFVRGAPAISRIMMSRRLP
jgi:hypothetical protein